MEWIFLQERTPQVSEEVVLGCDWYPEYSEKNFRIHVCDSDSQDQYWCGEKTGSKVLSVQNSICPDIGNGVSAYWMSIPDKEHSAWIKFDLNNPPKLKEYHEVLLRMHSGNYFVGYIESCHWCPSFNTFKIGYLESIDAYMELPERPKFIEPLKLNAEEIAVKKKKSEKWLNKFKGKHA